MGALTTNRSSVFKGITLYAGNGERHRVENLEPLSTRSSGAEKVRLNGEASQASAEWNAARESEHVEETIILQNDVRLDDLRIPIGRGGCESQVLEEVDVEVDRKLLDLHRERFVLDDVGVFERVPGDRDDVEGDDRCFGGAAPQDAEHRDRCERRQIESLHYVSPVGVVLFLHQYRRGKGRDPDMEAKVAGPRNDVLAFLSS
jgi:hypothetical protein